MSRPPRPPSPPGHRLCAQCYRDKLIELFVGARGNLVTWCRDCRDRYRNWDRKSEDERAAARPPVERTGNGYTVRLTLRSKNRKTGEIPVSTTDMKSCPSSCPHMDSGCYAGYGKAAAHWKSVARTGVPWADFCAQVAQLPAGQVWRHNEAGDLPGRGDRFDLSALYALVGANRKARARGFTFTHRRPKLVDEKVAIIDAGLSGFTVNLSADSLREADKLAAIGVAPVAVVLPSSAPDRGNRTPKGRAVVVCPNETHGITCDRCQLCTKAQRKAIVGFRAHGQAARRVSLRVVA